MRIRGKDGGRNKKSMEDTDSKRLKRVQKGKSS